MDLLDFARGPALQVAIYVFIAGSLWRVLGVLLLQRKPDHSDARQPGGFGGALKVIWSRSFTAPAFSKQTKYPKVLGYALHLGLFITVFFFVPHIVFFKGLFGIGWPGLPLRDSRISASTSLVVMVQTPFMQGCPPIRCMIHATRTWARSQVFAR